MAKVHLHIPTYSQSDDVSNHVEPRTFARLLYRRALAVGHDIYDPAAYILCELDKNMFHKRLISYLQRRAWAEWYFGTVTPARQITLLADDCVDLKLRLAQQIRDEIRHYEVFARQVREFGGDSALDEYEPPKFLQNMHAVQANFTTGAALAAANQYSGEVVLSVHSNPARSVLTRLLPKMTMDAIIDIEKDEPSHIALGRDLVCHYATTADQRREMCLAQEYFLVSLIAQHTREIESLGAERTRPLPIFS